MQRSQAYLGPELCSESLKIPYSRAVWRFSSKVYRVLPPIHERGQIYALQTRYAKQRQLVYKWTSIHGQGCRVSARRRIVYGPMPAKEICTLYTSLRVIVQSESIDKHQRCRLHVYNRGGGIVRFKTARTGIPHHHRGFGSTKSSSPQSPTSLTPPETLSIHQNCFAYGLFPRES